MRMKFAIGLSLVIHYLNTHSKESTFYNNSMLKLIDV